MAAQLAHFQQFGGRSLLDIPGPVDHVIFCTPARAIPEILEDCVTKGVRSAGIFSSGFSESEDPGGKRLEDEVLRIARKLVHPSGSGCSHTR